MKKSYATLLKICLDVQEIFSKLMNTCKANNLSLNKHSTEDPNKVHKKPGRQARYRRSKQGS